MHVLTGIHLLDCQRQEVDTARKIIIRSIYNHMVVINLNFYSQYIFFTVIGLILKLCVCFNPCTAVN